MEAQLEAKKAGRKKKEAGAKTKRVEIRITEDQRIFLDWAMNVTGMTQSDLLVKGVFSFCQEHNLFGPSGNYLMMRKMVFGKK
jgi:hypothetical protein